jgi:uncharacterized protein YqgC (DUF456 family)
LVESILGALGFGIAVAFIFVGIIGIIVPILPGTLLIWLTVLIYAWRTGFEVIGWPSLVFITIIAFIAGTAQFWLPLLGAQKQGAAKRAMFLGVVGAIIGTFVVPLVGTVIGYAVGIFLGEYMKIRDWNLALRASLGGIAGWGISTIIELVVAFLILLIFVVQVLFS